MWTRILQKSKDTRYAQRHTSVVQIVSESDIFAKDVNMLSQYVPQLYNKSPLVRMCKFDCNSIKTLEGRYNFIKIDVLRYVTTAVSAYAPFYTDFSLN
jgi:hypothetical protein